MKSIIFLIFAVVGLGLSYLAYALYSTSADLVANGVKAQGQVIENIVERDSDGADTYRPRIEFTAEGQKYQFASDTSTNPPAFQIGQGVNILYPKGEPNKAAIDEFLFLWLGPLIAGGMGILFLCTGLGLFIKNAGSGIKNMLLNHQENHPPNNPFSQNPPIPPSDPFNPKPPVPPAPPNGSLKI